LESGINKKIKVLWFTNTPSLYDHGKHQYNGGGWIESLEEILREQSKIELAIAFFHPNDNKKVTRDKVVYYPIKRENGRKNPIRSILNNWRGTIEEPEHYKAFLKIIDDFKPDVIHVFGTEGPFAYIQNFTNIPVVVHLQGLINPYLNTYFPVGYSKLDFVLSRYYFLKNLIGTSPVFNEKRFKAQAKRERKIFEKLKYVFGRTEWDHQIAKLFNPNIKYFHIDEVLRPVFYKRSSEVRKNDSNKFIILSTLSPTIYKGIDVVLRTAYQLSTLSNIEFEWRIIGLDESSYLLKFFERKEILQHRIVNIKLMGKMDPNQIVDEMLKADVFVHPSYIDNSPNSICEAQILGLPVIACNVGGISSLIKNDETGKLIPSNGIFELVSLLKNFTTNQTEFDRLGENGKNNAIYRHDKQKIKTQLLQFYSIIKGY
jgi:glycosyltransferase involved in cell wall biosynthesis